MKGHMAKCYGDLIQELWSGTQKNIAPLKLRVSPPQPFLLPLQLHYEMGNFRGGKVMTYAGLGSESPYNGTSGQFQKSISWEAYGTNLPR